MLHFIRLFFALLLCWVSSRVAAQTITIGTENNLDSADAGVLPFNPYYTYSYSQTIYLAEDIDAVDTIKAIQYHFKGTSLHNSRQLKIYMTTVQASEMTGWLLHSAFQKVFDGTIPDTSGDVWIRIPLDAPYVYYSRLNLAIAVDENSPSFDGDHDKFYFTNTPQNEGYRAMVLQDDTDNPEHGPLPTGEFQRAYANIKIEGMLYNCGKPRDPSVSSVKKDTTTISWLAPTKGPNAVRYIWRVLPKDIDVEDVAADSGTVVGLSAMVKGLRNGELYDFYVRTECDSNDYYRWTKALRFTAPCGPLSNFPFLEGFEVSNQLPICWNQIKPVHPNYLGINWQIKGELPKTGNNSISLQTNVATENWLILPPFKLNGHQRLRYSKRIKKEYYNSNDSLFYTIKISKTGRDSSDFTYGLVDTLLSKHTDYRDTIHDLTAFVGDVHIAFVVPKGMNKTNKLYLDDITVENIPNCIEPTKLQANNIGFDTARLSWERNGDSAAKWQIYYGIEAFTNPPTGIKTLNGLFALVDTNVYMLRHLKESYGYAWWIRRICEVGDTTRWSNIQRFNTGIACGAPENIRIDVDSTQATVRWSTANKLPRQYQFYWGVADTTNTPYSALHRPNGHILTVNDSSYTFRNLEYPKKYIFWLRSLCDTIYTEGYWIEKPLTFQTLQKNDRCKDAQLVTVAADWGTSIRSPIQAKAGFEGGTVDSCGFDNGESKRDVWFKFVAPANGQKIIITTISGESNVGWVQTLYDSCQGRRLMCAVNDSFKLCQRDYTPNATYYLRMHPLYDFFGDNSTANIYIYNETGQCPPLPTVPINDICGTAIPLTTADTLIGSTELAKIQNFGIPKPLCARDTILHDVWYKISSGTGSNRLLTTGVSFETLTKKSLYMAVYKGPCDSLEEVNSDAVQDCPFVASNTPYNGTYLVGLEDNQDYYVRIWHAEYRFPNNFGGPFKLYLDADYVLRDSANVGDTGEGRCTDALNVTIDKLNNNRWVPLVTGFGALIGEVKANGQNLGKLESSFFSTIADPRFHNNRQFLPRNFTINTEQKPTVPVTIRLYFSKEEWDTLRARDPSVQTQNLAVWRLAKTDSSYAVCQNDYDMLNNVPYLVDSVRFDTLNGNYFVEFNTIGLSNFFIARSPNANSLPFAGRVFLQGPYNATTGLMNDQLRTLNLIPTIEPYTTLSGFTNFINIKDNKRATTDPSVFSVSDSTALVDWVFLELRDSTNPALVVATQAAFVRRDGIIVDTLGQPTIYFNNMLKSSYYVAVRHRNHLGVRTATPLSMSEEMKASFDFTDSTAAIYTNSTITTNVATTTVRYNGRASRALWAGDVNRDSKLKYSGSNNDKGLILNRLGSVLTNTLIGYLSEDVNLNGTVKYSGASNDKGIILFNIGSVLTNVFYQHL